MYSQGIKLAQIPHFWKESPILATQQKSTTSALLLPLLSRVYNLPPPVLLPNPPGFDVFPNAPLPNPPEVAVLLALFPNSPPPLVVVFVPKAGLLPPNGEALLLLLEPKPLKPPDVAVLPPKRGPPVEALFAPKPEPVFEPPNPPKLFVLLLLPKPKDIIEVVRCLRWVKKGALLRLG